MDLLPTCGTERKRSENVQSEEVPKYWKWIFPNVKWKIPIMVPGSTYIGILENIPKEKRECFF
jgi:hypothetical protein